MGREAVNPLLQAAIGSILRALLQGAAGILVGKGIWTASEADAYVLALVAFLIGMGWSIWQKYKTALLMKAYQLLPAGAPEARARAMSQTAEVKLKVLQKDQP